MKAHFTWSWNLEPQELRRELQQGETSDLQRRRAIIALSLDSEHP